MHGAFSTKDWTVKKVVVKMKRFTNLPEHQRSHDERTEDRDEAEDGRRVKAVDAGYVTGAEERRQQ